MSFVIKTCRMVINSVDYRLRFGKLMQALFALSLLDNSQFSILNFQFYK